MFKNLEWIFLFNILMWPKTKNQCVVPEMTYGTKTWSLKVLESLRLVLEKFLCIPMLKISLLIISAYGKSLKNECKTHTGRYNLNHNNWKINGLATSFAAILSYWKIKVLKWRPRNAHHINDRRLAQKNATTRSFYGPSTDFYDFHEKASASGILHLNRVDIRWIVMIKNLHAFYKLCTLRPWNELTA